MIDELTRSQMLRACIRHVQAARAELISAMVMVPQDPAFDQLRKTILRSGSELEPLPRELNTYASMAATMEGLATDGAPMNTDGKILESM